MTRCWCQLVGVATGGGIDILFTPHLLYRGVWFLLVLCRFVCCSLHAVQSLLPFFSQKSCRPRGPLPRPCAGKATIRLCCLLPKDSWALTWASIIVISTHCGTTEFSTTDPRFACCGGMENDLTPLGEQRHRLPLRRKVKQVTYG